MKISLVAAYDRNRVIGSNGSIPWMGQLPRDMERFVNLTKGKPVVMGRKTFDSLPDKYRPLPGRKNIVLTRDDSYDAPGGVVLVDTPLNALNAAGSKKEVMIIGGAQVYKEFIPVADIMYLTFIDATFEGDSFFPDFDCKEWKVVKNERRPKDSRNALSCNFVTLKRVKSLE